MEENKNPNLTEPIGEGQMETLVIKPFIFIDEDYRFEIPLEVAKCGYCGKRLFAHAYEWTQDDDNKELWTPTSFDFECETMPDIGTAEWKDWFASHSDMPYVNEMPQEIKAEEWIQKIYRVKP